MNKEKVLKQLKNGYRDYDHKFGIIKEDTPDGFLNWEKAGSPYMWIEAQTKGNAVLLTDEARGDLALIIDDVVQDIGKDFVISKDQIIIGISEYYGVDKPKLYKALKEIK